MSVSTNQTETVSTPSSNRVQRLVVAAGRFLAKETGDTLPVEEVCIQAEANRYEDREITMLLKVEGLATTQTVRIPERGGTLW